MGGALWCTGRLGEWRGGEWERDSTAICQHDNVLSYEHIDCCSPCHGLGRARYPSITQLSTSHRFAGVFSCRVPRRPPWSWHHF